MTSTTLSPVVALTKKVKGEEMPVRFFNVVSLFSGAGGLDLGLEMAGYSTRACVEIDPVFRETMRRNRPDWNPLDDFDGDVTCITSDLLLERADLTKGQVDLLVGGPPCQSFSNMGNRKGVKDARGRLFRDYLRLVYEIRPLGIIFENVEGIKQHGVLDELQKELEAMGYKVKCETVIAADYGVPQKRKRVIVLGCLGVEPRFPKPTHSRFGDVPETKRWVTVGETFQKITVQDLLRPDCLGMNHSLEMVNRMKMVPPGGNFHDLPKKHLPDCWKSGKHQGQDTFGRLKLNEPSVTIRTSGYNPTKGRYIHPTENRGLNTLEMAALQSFPKDFMFVGNLKSVGVQIGNAVPPLLAKAIGEAMKPCLVEARLKLH
ncbi:hypothetical protein A2454_03630 [Candidatus Peribacteria bacterium RIFOXYC2_FULL_55_14]|nr:MAG: DNA-cytosine methyltransferase [Candidatus Peribacteria bacterium GW2011_GWB1_54_5]KKW41123.1 MAG: DNA-cytosine methyltransferase [Candidatus Peregrinibacteria bacterium GW2011_GWA2_54_9]OGJ71491.1 MAG: hypothetical protein A2198_04775 [Candidatus Peribacteria bacterium RIFOXYA1_FULL_56_14]OGJ72884.1 MAG: hypothetical protein A2217_06290 [Candidatus Peribacteria bacterium RIFOXYA2_FULL_55_28]OGJ74824.1 MAG: hypothetical protein A2384_02080 [Candidatus Peribacteria bacterium RIFOXYB1_FUL